MAQLYINKHELAGIFVKPEVVIKHYQLELQCFDVIKMLDHFLLDLRLWVFLVAKKGRASADRPLVSSASTSTTLVKNHAGRCGGGESIRNFGEEKLVKNAGPAWLAFSKRTETASQSNNLVQQFAPLNITKNTCGLPFV